MKSRSIVGVAAAAAAAAAANELEEDGAACNEPTGTEGIGLGVGSATGAEAPDATGADVGGVGWVEVTIVVGAGVDDATGVPGGGDATASGSSISSSGKSGSCSSKGETDTSAKASGKLGLTAVAEATDAVVDAGGAWNPAAGGWDANSPCNDVMVVPLAEVPPAGIDTVDAFDEPATASDEVGDAPTPNIPAAGDVLTDVPDAAGAAGDVLTDVRDAVGTVVDLLTDLPADVAVSDGAPGGVGIALP
jgi:hypothetical protein